MRAGSLDRLITVEKKTPAQDTEGYGSEVIQWVPLVALPGSPIIAEKFPANVRDVMPSRSESVKQGLALARNQTRIRMRYRSDVTSAMRITVHGDVEEIYQIVAGPAVVGERREMIEVMCEKYSTPGQGSQ